LGDYDWILRLIKANMSIEYINQTLSFVRIHEYQISRTSNTKDFRKERSIVYKRHRTNWHVMRITTFLLYWISVLVQLGRAYRKHGLRGIASLIRGWGERRKDAGSNKSREQKT
jgi:hypothetical protein